MGEEEDITKGYIICDKLNQCHVTTEIEAEIKLLELNEQKQIMSCGYQAVLHMHTLVEEIVVSKINWVWDVKNKKKKKIGFLKKYEKAGIRIECKNPICVEKFEDNPIIGRFTLRDESK